MNIKYATNEDIAEIATVEAECFPPAEAATEKEFVERVKYYGNWDVLRPAKIVEGLEPISENLLDKLNEEAQNMIEKMRCAV